MATKKYDVTNTNTKIGKAKPVATKLKPTKPTAKPAAKPVKAAKASTAAAKKPSGEAIRENITAMKKRSKTAGV